MALEVCSFFSHCANIKSRDKKRDRSFARSSFGALSVGQLGQHMKNTLCVFLGSFPPMNHFYRDVFLSDSLSRNAIKNFSIPSHNSVLLVSANFSKTQMLSIDIFVFVTKVHGNLGSRFLKNSFCKWQLGVCSIQEKWNFFSWYLWQSQKKIFKFLCGVSLEKSREIWG